MTASALPRAFAATTHRLKLPARDAAFWPLAALVLLGIMQFSLVFTRAINWDEFSYWREAAWFADGRLDRPLQTIHARAFAWLAGHFDTSVDHIVAARVFMFGCLCISAASLFSIARRFVLPATALLVPLAYISAGFVIQHGTAFRTDAIATALLTTALAILASDRLSLLRIAMFGVLLGLAGMVTIKSVLYLPAFVGLAYWRTRRCSDWQREQIIRLVACAGAAALAFVAFYLSHAQGVSALASIQTKAGTQLGNAGGYAFFLGVPLYWPFFVKAMLTAPVLALCLAAAPFLLTRAGMPLGKKAALAGFWLPLTTVAFYTNTLAYYYAFLFAPLAVGAIPALEWARKNYGLGMLSLAFAVPGLTIGMLDDRSMIDRQRQLERNVHEVFAEPVPYFDHNFMLGSWPKANGFMTLWGLTAYRNAGEPLYREAMENQTVPLLLANYPELEALVKGEQEGLLLPADTAALRDNYIAFSWPIWVAGKAFPASSGPIHEEFLVPGPYTVEGGPVIVDGKRLSKSEVVHIERGMHVVEAQGPARLVWGDHLPRPAQPLQPGPLYVGF